MTTPTRLRLESTTACQLACPTCPTAGGEVEAALGCGFLRAADFRRLLDQSGHHIESVELSNFGEPFLNPQLLDLLRIAHERGVAITLENGANLNTVRPEVLEGLVRYGVRSLRCSIDGTTEEVYAAYRRNGSLAAVLANIKALNAHKSAAKSRFPELTWQFVVFGHNQHQLADARAMARILGMRFFPKLSWDSGHSPVTAVTALEAELGHAATRERYAAAKGEPYFGRVCEDLWDQPQINFDGRMLGCCVNHWAEFGGNAFEDLNAAVNSPRMIRARAMLEGKAAADPEVPCSRCHLYAARVKLGKWVVRNAEMLSPSTCSAPKGSNNGAAGEETLDPRDAR